jgi:hypothetical protein
MTSKPAVRTITIDRHILNNLRQKLKSPNISKAAKNALIKKIAGGFWSQCEEIPTRLVSYDVGGAQLIEKYCDECFKKWDKLEKKKLGY